MKKGLLIVMSGPAGSGKGTVHDRLLQSPEYAYSVSATTRAPRPGEENGKDYWFISVEEFQKKIAEGDLLEYNYYCGNYYGTLKKETETVLESGRNLILEIDVNGAMNVKKICPEAILIMLLPPSYAKQEERLRGRATETEDKILARLAQTKEEMVFLPNYDYTVYNMDNGIDACAEDIRAIVRAEKLATRRDPDAAQRFLENR